MLWDRTDEPGSVLGDELPIHPVPEGDSVPPVAAGRQALGWWLVGAGRAMLSLARQHALDRSQFGRPVASFQAIRHRLAETLVAIEGAEATLLAAAAEPDELGFLLAKAAAGQAASIAARHCQQVLGGIGFTEEHELHRHVKRALVLDGLLGSSRELTREAGATLRAKDLRPRAGAVSQFRGKPEYPLGDDVPLNFGRAAGDGRGEAAEVAIEPAAVVGIQVQRRIWTGDGGVGEPVDTRWRPAHIRSPAARLPTPAA